MPIIPILMAVASLGLGLAQGISAVKQANKQVKIDDAQTMVAMKERARQAKKMMQLQETSFLKSGVYFDGTPRAVINETGDASIEDLNAMENDAINRQNLLKRQGRTAFYSSMLNGIIEAGTSFVNFGGLSKAASKTLTTADVANKISNSKIGTNVQNWYSGLRGWNKGSFYNSMSDIA